MSGISPLDGGLEHSPLLDQGACTRDGDRTSVAIAIALVNRLLLRALLRTYPAPTILRSSAYRAAGETEFMVMGTYCSRCLNTQCSV